MVYLLLHLLMHKSAQHSSSNGKSDISLEGALGCELDVTLEGDLFTSL